jgi:hypothetical protein
VTTLSSLRGAQRRSNPEIVDNKLGCFVPHIFVFVATKQPRPVVIAKPTISYHYVFCEKRHCEERSDETIQFIINDFWVASSLRSSQ